MKIFIKNPESFCDYIEKIKYQKNICEKLNNYRNVIIYFNEKNIYKSFFDRFLPENNRPKDGYIGVLAGYKCELITSF